MMKARVLLAVALALSCMVANGKKEVKKAELWPDGTPIAAWFSDTAKVDATKLGR